jgi:hypothetical protein
MAIEDPVAFQSLVARSKEALAAQTERKVGVK